MDLQSSSGYDPHAHSAVFADQPSSYHPSAVAYYYSWCSYRPQNRSAALVCCTSAALHNRPNKQSTAWGSSQSKTMPSSVLPSCCSSQKKILPSSVLCIFGRLGADRSSFKSASMDCVLFCCAALSSVSVDMLTIVEGSARSF